MLLILPTLVLLATAVHIPADNSQATRAFSAYNIGRREPEYVREESSFAESVFGAETVHTHESSSERVNPESPCPDVFSYEGRTTEKETWYGVVLIKAHEYITGINLVIQLNKKAVLLGSHLGKATTNDNIEFSIWNSRKKVRPGLPVSVEFFVKFNDKEGEPPRIRSISVNGNQICVSSERPTITTGPVSRPITPSTTITSTTTTATNSGPSTIHHGQHGFERPTITTGPVPRPIIPSTTITSTTTTATNSGPSTIHHGQHGFVDGAHCGIVKVQPAPLITNGQLSSRGQWPWHVALYQVKGTDQNYICGGTLIGKRNVLTAAHCVTQTINSRPVDPATILVYLGKYHLNLWFTGGVQDKLVDTIKVHPEYNNTNFYADIAIIVLASDAEFTNFVQPVCLWDRDEIALETVETLEGTVVGWGYDESGNVTEELMMAKMPVVSVETCIWSYPAFFSRFTSDKTYCAGFRNGTSACNGDSGGGMVFPLKGKPNSPETWHLRGIVSLGASLKEKRTCNTEHYVIFTDVAKYLDWIEKTMFSVNN